MPNYNDYKTGYTNLLSTFKVTRSTEVSLAAQKILNGVKKYDRVEDKTGVPWYFIGAIHLRESDCDFNTHLHNGDSLDERTVHVPKGRPLEGEPPFTWEVSAIDALTQKGLEKNKDWSWERMCFELERYNGFGYRGKKINSPYLWAGTTAYTKGKYVSDGKFSKTHIDTQLGLVPVIKKLRELVRPRKEIVDSSRKLTILQRIRNAVVGLVTSVLGMDWLGMLGQVKQFATDHASLLLIAGAGSVWAIFKLIEGYSIQDYRDGRYTPSKDQE